MRTRVAALITLAFAAISQAAPSGFADSSSRLDARANTGDCPVPKYVPALPPTSDHLPDSPLQASHRRMPSSLQD